MAECTRTMGCKCPLCDMSAAAMGDIDGSATIIECTRAAGCACPLCDISAAALSDITASHNAADGQPPGGGGGQPAPTYTFCAINFNADRKRGCARQPRPHSCDLLILGQRL